MVDGAKSDCVLVDLGFPQADPAQVSVCGPTIFLVLSVTYKQST